MTTELEKMRVAHDEWLLKNPLKQRIKNLGWTHHYTAGVLQVSAEAVHNWITASQKPKPENMRRIAVVLDITPAKAQAEWDNWLKERP